MSAGAQRPGNPRNRAYTSLTAMTGPGKVRVRHVRGLVVMRYTAKMPVGLAMAVGLVTAGAFLYAGAVLSATWPSRIAIAASAGTVFFVCVAILLWTSDRLEFEPMSGKMLIRRRRPEPPRGAHLFGLDYKVRHIETSRQECTLAIVPVVYPVRIGSTEFEFLTRRLGFRGFAVCLVSSFAPVFVFSVSRTREQAETDVQEAVGLFDVPIDRTEVLPIDISPVM